LKSRLGRWKLSSWYPRVVWKVIVMKVPLPKSPWRVIKEESNKLYVAAVVVMIDVVIEDRMEFKLVFFGFFVRSESIESINVVFFFYFILFFYLKVERYRN